MSCHLVVTLPISEDDAASMDIVVTDAAEPGEVLGHVVTSPRAVAAMVNLHPRSQLTDVARLVQMLQLEAGEGIPIA